MEFNENTQFPVFSKLENGGEFYYYTSEYICFIFKGSESVVIQNSVCKLEVYEQESLTTKEEFIESNKELLEKTGLINLFQTSEKNAPYRKCCKHFERKYKNSKRGLFKRNPINAKTSFRCSDRKRIIKKQAH